MLETATILTGLSAGLFAAFSFAVMPGLRRTDDAAFVASMRAINVAILNPVFLVVFLGAFAATAVAVVGDERAWTLTALALYAGMLAVTFAVNVPLNNALEAGSDSVADRRTAFERRWVRWNHARALLSTAAFACLVIAVSRS